MNRRNTFIVALLLAASQTAESFAPASPVGVTKPDSSTTSLNGFFGFGRRHRKSKDADITDSSILPEQQTCDDATNPIRDSRRSFLSTTAATASLFPLRSVASDKQTNLSDDDLRRIILSDIVDKSFLVSADITRSVYDESATFTDEIDVYTMDKWIKGTKSLFIPSGSRVSLVGDVNVSSSEVNFRFDEDLMFNIPFKPVCSLSGKVVLTRDEKSGLITSYREYWDQSVNDVLKTAKFGKKV